MTILFFFLDLELTFLEILSIILHLLILFLTFFPGLIATVPVGVESSKYDGYHHCKEHAAIED